VKVKEVSDHEFSPESDLEGEEVPVRRARTAIKGNHYGKYSFLFSLFTIPTLF
jgi:hypothetical protein